MEEELQAACDAGEFTALHTNLSACSVDIRVELRHKAEVLHQRLEHQLKITEFLTSRHHHENYKDIRKDVKKINDMVAAAQEQGIELD